eukprot:9575927-Alexandrium_andersonii.AAC.1
MIASPGRRKGIASRRPNVCYPSCPILIRVALTDPCVQPLEIVPDVPSVAKLRNEAPNRPP